jgi:ABC-type cobalamin transport system ATPase subunit
MLTDQATNIKDKLKEVFGYGQFRGNQEVIIGNVLAGKNTFVIMPTGAGKSSVLSASCHCPARYSHCYFAAHCLNEKSGRPVECSRV